MDIYYTLLYCKDTVRPYDPPNLAVAGATEAVDSGSPSGLASFSVAPGTKELICPGGGPRMFSHRSSSSVSSHAAFFSACRRSRHPRATKLRHSADGRRGLEGTEGDQRLWGRSWHVEQSTGLQSSSRSRYKRCLVGLAMMAKAAMAGTKSKETSPVPLLQCSKAPESIWSTVERTASYHEPTQARRNHRGTRKSLASFANTIWTPPFK